MVQRKKCRDCGKLLSLSSFRVEKNGKVRGRCKPCERKERRDRHYKSNYNMSEEEANNMRTSGCLICERMDELHIDHCHVGGNVRGVLCRRCNLALGMFEDNVKLMGKAIRYLIKFGGK